MPKTPPKQNKQARLSFEANIKADCPLACSLKTSISLSHPLGECPPFPQNSSNRSLKRAVVAVMLRVLSEKTLKETGH